MNFMFSEYFYLRAAICRTLTALLPCLITLCPLSVAGHASGFPQQEGHLAPLAPDQTQILTRAREILNQAAISEAEREVRLQVVRATLTGTAIRPDDDYPEIRNPKYWTLLDDVFIVAPGSMPVDAIADLWIVHENDGVPVPRIRCYKYSTLILIEGYIQYFRHTGNAAGLAALNRLIGSRKIPNGLPNYGDGLLWKRRLGGNDLLPGDQVWFDNPFFGRGQELIYQESCQAAIREGKSPEAAAALAAAYTKALIAGEEGSNVFCLGDDKFIRCASSLSRLCRDSFQRHEKEEAAIHEQVLTPKIFTFSRFQEHMVDDNYSAQACLRANPGGVQPKDFKIERVRAPMDPGVLLRLYAGSAPSQSLASMIDAMASRNRPPRLVPLGDATVPLFEKAYDWSEQQRVRRAMDAVARIRSDEAWWQLRERIHDGRYVLTAARGGVTRNFTLGAICSDILDSRLCLAFVSHLPSVPGRLPASFQPEEEYWRHEAEWAARRAPLYAMQAALCQRAIEQWDAVAGTLPGSDGQSHVYTADEKARYVAALKKEIARRKETKKAAYEEVVVPWLPAPDGWEGFDAQRAQEARTEYERKIAEAN